MTVSEARDVSAMGMYCATEVGMGAGKLTVHSAFPVEVVCCNNTIAGTVIKLNNSVD